MTCPTLPRPGVVDPPVLLAPLAGFSDLPFRMMIRELGGLGLGFTEMLHPLALLRGTGDKMACLTATEPADTPLAWQLYGRDPELLARAARVLAARGARWIDLNMGCPVRKIVSRGEGAALLKTPDLAARIAEEVVRAVPGLTVSAKIRLGWDDSCIVAPALARQLVSAGISALIIHGRTAVQGFKGKADWNRIADVVASVPGIPIYGNGDISDGTEAIERMKSSGCTGIMVGRAAMKNPWLIPEIAATLQGQPVPPPPTPSEALAFALRHLARTSALYGKGKGAVLFRKWMPLYVRPFLRMKRAEMVALMAERDADVLAKQLAVLCPESVEKDQAF